MSASWSVPGKPFNAGIQLTTKPRVTRPFFELLTALARWSV